MATWFVHQKITGYDVLDPSGRVIGVFRKEFAASLLRSTWQIVDPADETRVLVVAQERSKALALIRRLWDWIPYIGDVPFFVKYHFDFIDPQTQRTVGEYFKTTRFRDFYRLAVDDGVLRSIDWRTFVCLGVVMDALQGR